MFKLNNTETNVFTGRNSSKETFKFYTYSHLFYLRVHVYLTKQLSLGENKQRLTRSDYDCKDFIRQG